MAYNTERRLKEDEKSIESYATPAVSIEKGNADKFNWTTIENKYSDFSPYINEEVKKTISTKAAQGKWFTVRTYNDSMVK